FLHVGEDPRIVGLLAKILQEGFDFAEHHEHLSRETRLEKKLAAQRAMQHQGSCYFPVSPSLPQPRIFLGTQCGGDLHNVLHRLWPESQPPVSRLAKLSFPSQVVELKDQLSIARRSLVSHAQFSCLFFCRDVLNQTLNAKKRQDRG